MSDQEEPQEDLTIPDPPTGAEGECQYLIFCKCVIPASEAHTEHRCKHGLGITPDSFDYLNPSSITYFQSWSPIFEWGIGLDGWDTGLRRGRVRSEPPGSGLDIRPIRIDDPRPPDAGE